MTSPGDPQAQPSSDEVARLLAQARAGDDDARAAFHAAVYGELRRVAAGYMAKERAEHTLQPTALVNEAFLRMGSSPVDALADRALFFYSAARAMRQVLIDHARFRGRAKRSAVRVELDEALASYEDRGIDMVDLGSVLEALDQADPYLARIVELRFFVGLEASEIAELEGKSVRTLRRDLQFARAWLRTKLGDGETDERHKASSGEASEGPEQ